MFFLSVLVIDFFRDDCYVKVEVVGKDSEAYPI